MLQIVPINGWVFALREKKAIKMTLIYRKKEQEILNEYMMIIYDNF